MAINGGWRTFMCYNLGTDNKSIADQLADDGNLYYSGFGNGLITAGDPAIDLTTPSTHVYSGVFGDLYQWGRISDGHEKRNSPNSATTNAPSAGPYTAMANAWPAGSEQIQSVAPDYGKFIINTNYPYNWNTNPTGRNISLWPPYRNTSTDPCTHVIGIDGGNDFWRIPTQEEWSDIWRGGISASNTANKWVWKVPGANTSGQYGIPGGYEIKPDDVTTTLFLPAAGTRAGGNNSDGTIYAIGVFGNYWSATAYGDYSYRLHTTSNAVFPTQFYDRANGFSLRCIAEL